MASNLWSCFKRPSKRQETSPRCGGLRGSPSDMRGDDSSHISYNPKMSKTVKYERGEEEGEIDSVEDTKEDKTYSPEEETNRQIQTADQCEINQKPPGRIRFGVLNAQSMYKKAPSISELITTEELDVFLITETWLKKTRLKVLRRASPKGFQSRPIRRGGGVATLFLKQRKPKPSDSPDKKIKTTTFEFVVTELKHNDWDQPVLIINLYLPPGYNKAEFRTFLNEFQSLLDEVKKNFSSIIVAGDFNIHVNEEKSDTEKFHFLLWVNNLKQHVDEPTHKGGNTLDLVITTNVEIYNLIAHDDGISDHYTVYFYAKPKDTREKTEENENEEQK